MDWNTLLFVIFPYIALLTATIVTIYRSIYRPFSISRSGGSARSRLTRSPVSSGTTVPSSSWTAVVLRHARKIAVFTLDTGRLPEETHSLFETARDKYPVSIQTYFPDAASIQTWIEQNGPNAFYKSVAQRQPEVLQVISAPELLRYRRGQLLDRLRRRRRRGRRCFGGRRGGSGRGIRGGRWRRGLAAAGKHG